MINRMVAGVVALIATAGLAGCSATARHADHSGGAQVPVNVPVTTGVAVSPGTSPAVDAGPDLAAVDSDLGAIDAATAQTDTDFAAADSAQATSDAP